MTAELWRFLGLTTNVSFKTLLRESGEKTALLHSTWSELSLWRFPCWFFPILSCHSSSTQTPVMWASRGCSLRRESIESEWLLTLATHSAAQNETSASPDDTVILGILVFSSRQQQFPVLSSHHQARDPVLCASFFRYSHVICKNVMVTITMVTFPCLATGDHLA